ncbi:MAG: trypsin-like peptidase domain-containing protein [Lentisphaeria bacterium]|nr:trypsin-like peptidase domain-containing protein [Lentisphaeria bacterium]
MSKGLQLVLAAGLLCMLTGAAADEAEAGKPKSLFSRIKKNDRVESAATRTENANFLIVRSPGGNGSAFLTRLWDQPVIVTNAHVYLEMRNPEVVDVNGKVYKITEVLGSKTRDLAILAYEGSENEKNELLKVVGDVNRVPKDAPVEVCGNSLGGGVFVTQQGRLLAVGPDRVEFDAPAVQGNSGGPVMLSESGEVVGVVTSHRLVSLADPAWRDTQFLEDRRARGLLGGKSNIAVRRFATRIDNLSTDDLEPLDLAALDDERVLATGIRQWIEKVGSSRWTRADLTAECILNSAYLFAGEGHEWHSTYLRNEYERCRKDMLILLEKTGLDKELGQLRLTAGLMACLPQMAVTNLKGAQVRCFACRGGGKISSKRENPNYSKYTATSKYLITNKICSICSGKGQRRLWDDTLQFEMPEEVREVLGGNVRPATQTFGGFTLGGDAETELERYPFYQREPLYRVPNGFGETLVFAGNHADPAAASTTLTFMFGKLVKVEVVSSECAPDREVALRPFLTEPLSDAAPFLVSAFAISKFRDIPVDRSGRPLIKQNRNLSAERPVYGGNDDDDDGAGMLFEGMLVRGEHKVYRMVSQWDLHKFVPYCKR